MSPSSIPKRKPLGKASKAKGAEPLGKARLSNVKSEEEKHHVQWSEEMEDIRALIASEKHRRRVSMASFPQVPSHAKTKIKLARLKMNHRGVQYSGRAKGFVIRLNMHPGAHVGSKNAADNLEASMYGLTRLVVWSAVGNDTRLVTHFEWDDGQLAYPQRFIKQIVVINADGQPKTLPVDGCWYVIDKAGKVVKYD